MKNNFIKKTLSTLTICALLPLNCLTTSANNCSDTRWKGGSGGCDSTWSYVYEKNHAYTYGQDRKCSVRPKDDATSIYVYNKSTKKAKVTVMATNHNSGIVPNDCPAHYDNRGVPDQYKYKELSKVWYVPSKSERFIPQYIKENFLKNAHVHFETTGTNGLWSPDSVGWYPNADVK